MEYIPRRLLMIDENGNSQEIVDRDFFNLDGPLVVLGEPGAGKSELLLQYRRSSGSRIYQASEIEMFPVAAPESSGQKILIDGLDEITAYTTGGIKEVLRQISTLEKPEFVIACRSVDWQDAINARIIQNKWGRLPVVGTLLPLSNEEITSFISANGSGVDAQEFIRQADRHDVTDLLKNPQTLKMLLDAVGSDGWPNTRTKLFQNSCKSLVTEHNRYHDSRNTNRPASDRLIEASGFICAQLLLSGKRRVAMEGEHQNAPKIQDLAGGDFDEATLRSALSTRVFRAAEEGHVEPCHRTVAEFLAAKWISSAIARTLSEGRLANLIYGRDGIVPSALRGLHAWIATLCPRLADRYIEQDPYGVFRYGDPAQLSLGQSRKLLTGLEKVAEEDPYFRSGDWHVSMGRGLAKPDLREDILRVVRNSADKPYLSHLLLESIRGDDFVLTIIEDLKRMVTDPDMTLYERQAALEALRGTKGEVNWVDVAEELDALKDANSLSLALDIIEENSTASSGKLIAQILIEFEKTRGPERGLSIGEGYRLAGSLSVAQLNETLQLLAKFQSDQEKLFSVETWILRLLRERLVREPTITPEAFLSYVEHVDEHELDEYSWRKFSADYFSVKIEFRQAIQKTALSSAGTAEAFSEAVYRFATTYPGLYLREDDFIHHLESLIAQKDSLPDWVERWTTLMRFGHVHSGFSGSLNELIQRHVSTHPELKPGFEEIASRNRRRWERAQARLDERREAKRQAEIAKRHAHFRSRLETIMAGTALGDAKAIAQAYLAQFPDFDNSKAPEDRVGELVGQSTQAAAVESLGIVLDKNKIPTVREISELHAKESATYHLEYVLAAQSHVLLRHDPTLVSVPKGVAESMLSSLQRGIYSKEAIGPEAQERLEQIVFSDVERKQQFVRDWLEPYLEHGKNIITGLHRLTRDKQFGDVLADLSLEWLERFPNIAPDVLEEIIVAAVQYAKRNKLIEIARGKLSGTKWEATDRRREMWLGVLFLIDFEHTRAEVETFIETEPNAIWILRDVVSTDGKSKSLWPNLSDYQNHFIVSKFGAAWPPGPRPSGWSGNTNPWDATEFINSRITALSLSVTEDGQRLLANLRDREELKGYRNSIKHLYAQQARRISELSKVPADLLTVRKVLLECAPASYEDLQSLLLEQFERLQRLIHDTPTDNVEAYWDKDGPRDENYCRNRIQADLNPYLERYGVRLDIESAMPNAKRCDLLGSHQTLNVPTEIKGQWHDEVWMAAETQLANYTRDYRTEGWGIYLVFWFGYIQPNHPRNPHGWTGQPAPKTLSEMRALLEKRYPSISSKTKIFVLDLTRRKKS